MQRFLSCLSLVVVLILTGCVSLSIDRKFVGTFISTDSEMLVLLSDARVFHVQVIDGKEKRTFVGYFACRKSDPNTLLFAGPDSSPFLGSSFEISPDFTRLTARWGEFHKPMHSWKTEYRRNDGGE
jgi:hypothetical protein